MQSAKRESRPYFGAGGQGGEREITAWNSQIRFLGRISAPADGVGTRDYGLEQSNSIFSPYFGAGGRGGEREITAWTHSSKTMMFWLLIIPQFSFLGDKSDVLGRVFWLPINPQLAFLSKIISNLLFTIGCGPDILYLPTGWLA